MSAVTYQYGFKLTTPLEAQRGMTEAEALRFLATGETPDLSQPASEPSGPGPDFQDISLSDARAWLTGERPEALVAAVARWFGVPDVLVAKFDPRQPRDSEGKWTDGPPDAAGVPDFPQPDDGSSATSESLPAGKKAVPAVIYKKHADGAVVAESGDRRMRWDGGAKKFVVEQRSGGDWQEIARLTKTAAYEDTKVPGRWFEPGSTATKSQAQPESAPVPAPVPVPDYVGLTHDEAVDGPNVSIADVIPSTEAPQGEFNQNYEGPRFELPENVDLAVLDKFRTDMAAELYETRLVDYEAQKLRAEHPDMFPGYSSYEKYQNLVREQLLEKGIIKGVSADPALESLYDALSQISSFDEREAVRRRLHSEASVQAHLAVYAQRHDLGPPSPKLKRELAKKLKNEFANKKIAVRVTPKNLEHILRDGRIKSQFETGKSKGMNNQVGRAQYEQIMFGIDPKIDKNPEKRPIYGYVAVDGIRPATYHEGSLGGIGTDALTQYGQVQVVLKDSVRDRTTAMYGDSLNHAAFGLPSPINQPSWLSYTPMNNQGGITGNLDTLNRDPRDFKLRSQIYVEAQVHDGVSTDDIAEVVFPSKPSATVQQLLAERSIPWRVLTLKSGVEAGGELGDTSRIYAQQQRDYALKKIAPLEERIAKYQAEGKQPGYYEDATKDLQRLKKMLKEADTALAVK